MHVLLIVVAAEAAHHGRKLPAQNGTDRGVDPLCRASGALGPRKHAPAAERGLFSRFLTSSGIPED